jgi:hypothetical protein
MDFKRGSLVIKGVKGVFTVRYSGVGTGTNATYSANGWRTRHALKTKYSKIFQHLLSEAGDIPWMTEYMLFVFYNSKHDPSNISGFSKLMEDNLKQIRKEGVVVRKGYVYDDSKKYCKGTAQWPDESLPHNTFEFVIIQLK